MKCRAQKQEDVHAIELGSGNTENVIPRKFCVFDLFENKSATEIFSDFVFMYMRLRIGLCKTSEFAIKIMQEDYPYLRTDLFFQITYLGVLKICI